MPLTVLAERTRHDRIGYLNAREATAEHPGWSDIIMTASVASSRVQLLHLPDCPLIDHLIDEVEECLTEARFDGPVEVIVGDYPSPTLLIDGIDVATGAALAGQPRCRLDLPSREQIHAALAAHGLAGAALRQARQPTESEERSI
jgi:hypothetical protein